MWGNVKVEAGERCLSLEVHEARMPPLPLEEAHPVELFPSLRIT